jgi:hypothetical protein
MKQTFFLSILGMAGVSALGQGVIRLDNYNTYGPLVTYGPGWGPLTGSGLGTGWTMGFYYWNALGDFTGSTAVDPGGMAVPTTLGNYVLATGPGSAAAFETSTAGLPGEAMAANGWLVPISPSPTGGATITLMVLAYTGSSYATAFGRGHSGPFTLVTSDISAPATVMTGTYMPAFSIYIVPEPSALAFAGLGAVAWPLFRRRRS